MRTFVRRQEMINGKRDRPVPPAVAISRTVHSNKSVADGAPPRLQMMD
jgi:hypothetical protein